jgi:hypothetical protein
MFWIHGVNTQVQFTKEYPSTAFAGEPDAGTPTAIVRNANGTTVRQDGDGRGRRTSNWFHLAIPTATQLVDREVDIWHVWLQGEINGQATIVGVDIYEGGGRTKERIYRDDGLSLSARALDEDYRLNTKCKDPLVLCLKVLFEDGGQVIFAGAGAQIVGPETGG